MSKKHDKAGNGNGKGNGNAASNKPVMAKPARAKPTIGKLAMPKAGNGGVLRLNKSGKLSRADYEAEMQPLELALNNLGRWLQHTGQRLAVLQATGDQADAGAAAEALAHINLIAAPSVA